jgi:hypothetical protein
MTTTKSNRMKSLAVGAAMTLVLGAGATVLFMPSASAAVAGHGTDNTLGHVRSSGSVRPAGHGADDTLGHVRHSGRGAVRQARWGVGDRLGHVRHSGTDVVDVLPGVRRCRDRIGPAARRGRDGYQDPRHGGKVRAGSGAGLDLVAVDEVGAGGGSLGGGEVLAQSRDSGGSATEAPHSLRTVGPSRMG